MKKKVGIILNGTLVNKQIYDLIKFSLSSKNYLITTLIINNSKIYRGNLFSKIKKYINKRGFNKFISRAIFKSLCVFEKFLIINNKKYQGFFKKYDLKQFDIKIIYVNANFSNNGLIQKYDQEDLKKINEENLNLIVRGESAILKGDILNLCPNGVISFHHADNDINRGGPPGFWEVYFQDPRTGFVIQRLKEELDSGDVYYKGFVKTSWIYTLNLIRLYEISNSFIHLVLDDLTSSSPKFKIKKKVPYYNTLFTDPSPFQIFKYLLKTLNIFLKKLIRKVRKRKYNWNVAYQFSEKWNDITLWRSKTIPNPKNGFLADPFIIKKFEKHFCFLESYNYKESKGNISVYEICDKGSKFIGTALNEEFHLSYPFLFEYKDELYMCPETHQNNDIRIYKCQSFPLDWRLHKIIMNNVNAAETNIFFKNSKWWLMTNISPKNYNDHDTQLHIFYSDNPLTDNWKKHELNPVIFDPLKARGGGMILFENEIFRVHQEHGFDMYGKSLGVSKITKICTKTFEEKKIFDIKPNFFNGAKGTHTFNFNEGLVVFDYVKISNQ